MIEEDLFQLAKSYFDVHELDRVVYTLRDAKGARSRFLRQYAAFLVRANLHFTRVLLTSQNADRRTQESLEHFLDTKQERLLLFPLLNPIAEELAHETEPYLVYLRGLVHMRLEQREEAMRCFVASIKERPYNWSCWSQLAQMVDSADRVSYRLECFLTRSLSKSRSSCPCRTC